MTDAISRAGALTPTVAQPAKKRVDDAPGAPAPVAVSRDDQLALSAMAQKVMAEPGFDADKVESIKKAIAEGNYPLDSRRIAESFAALERMISDNSAGR